MAGKLRGLYAITPEFCDRDRLLASVEAALRGGCRFVQYRDKTSAAPERLARAHALRLLTLRYNARLLINDDMALTFLVKADGIHLGRNDGNLVAARAILGPDRLLGASCYGDFAIARKAAAAGADYVAFGAVFPSLTKPNAVSAAVDLFCRAKTTLTVASCAIGGVALDKAPSLIAAGADLLAVISDLFNAPDITARAAAYQHLFEEPRA